LAVVAHVAANPAANATAAMAARADEGGDAAKKAAAAKTDAPAKAEPPAKPENAGKPEGPAKPVDGPPTSDADLALQLLLARFPDERLREPEVRESLRSDLERHRLRSLLLATVPLANGDEPGFHFGAYRRGGIS
jgi:hypothetical protein